MSTCSLNVLLILLSLNNRVFRLRASDLPGTSCHLTIPALEGFDHSRPTSFFRLVCQTMGRRIPNARTSVTCSVPPPWQSGTGGKWTLVETPLAAASCRTSGLQHTPNSRPWAQIPDQDLHSTVLGGFAIQRLRGVSSYCHSLDHHIRYLSSFGPLFGRSSDLSFCSFSQSLSTEPRATHKAPKRRSKAPSLSH